MSETKSPTQVMRVRIVLPFVRAGKRYEATKSVEIPGAPASFRVTVHVGGAEFSANISALVWDVRDDEADGFTLRFRSRQLRVLSDKDVHTAPDLRIPSATTRDHATWEALTWDDSNWDVQQLNGEKWEAVPRRTRAR